MPNWNGPFGLTCHDIRLFELTDRNQLLLWSETKSHFQKELSPQDSLARTFIISHSSILVKQLIVDTLYNLMLTKHEVMRNCLPLFFSFNLNGPAINFISNQSPLKIFGKVWHESFSIRHPSFSRSWWSKDFKETMRTGNHGRRYEILRGTEIHTLEPVGPTRTPWTAWSGAWIPGKDNNTSLSGCVDWIKEGLALDTCLSKYTYQNNCTGNAVSKSQFKILNICVMVTSIRVSWLEQVLMLLGELGKLVLMRKSFCFYTLQNEITNCNDKMKFTMYNLLRGLTLKSPGSLV